MYKNSNEFPGRTTVVFKIIVVKADFHIKCSTLASWNFDKDKELQICKISLSEKKIFDKITVKKLSAR